MNGYQFIDHTADVAVRARAETLAALLGQFARAFRDIVYEEGAGERDSETFEIAAPTPEDAIVEFLGELIFRAFAEGRVVADVAAIEPLASDEIRFRCRLAFETIDEPATEIKAATYHGLEVKTIEGGVEATVVFDV
jgi:SHS2 domain-containing protein